MQKVYAAVKAVKPEAVFGISPQGNNDNNYSQQYSDVALWLSTPGYVDYIMPQVYWGYNYTLQNGSARFAFENIVDEWLAMPRDDSVSLAFGLGAYRIGAGDGSATESGNGPAATIWPIWRARFPCAAQTATRCTVMPACTAAANMRH